MSFSRAHARRWAGNPGLKPAGGRHPLLPEPHATRLTRDVFRLSTRAAQTTYFFYNATLQRQKRQAIHAGLRRDEHRLRGPFASRREKTHSFGREKDVKSRAVAEADRVARTCMPAWTRRKYRVRKCPGSTLGVGHNLWDNTDVEGQLPELARVPAQERYRWAKPLWQVTGPMVR